MKVVVGSTNFDIDDLINQGIRPNSLYSKIVPNCVVGSIISLVRKVDGS